MKRNDSVFIFLLILLPALMAGMMIESVRSALLVKSAVAKIDVQKVKEDLKKAGLAPYEAKYWKALTK